MKTLKIIIADSNPKFKKDLAAFINNHGNDYTLCGSFSSGAALLNTIEEKKPDIVFTNVKLLGVNGIDVIRECNTKWPHVHFVAMSDSLDFNTLKSVLRLGVSDILHKPVTEDAFNDSLTYVTNIIINEKIHSTLNNANNALHSKLFSDAIYKDIPSTQPSLERINQKYGCSFKDGEFKAILIKLDYKNGYDDNQRNTQVAYIDTLASTTFVPACHDILMNNKCVDALIILNYKPSSSAKISALTEGLFTSICDYLSGSDVSCTVCVSDSVNNFVDIRSIIMQCRHLDWLRLFIGTGRIITSADLITSTMANQEKARKYKEAICAHVDNVNIEAFNDTVTSFFNEPETFLTTIAASNTIYDMYSYILNRYHDIIDANMDIEEADNRFSNNMYCSSTVAQLKNSFVNMSDEFLSIARANQSSFNEHILRQTYAYIQRHYSEKISLERISSAVSLSPGYFSNYFKKSTGINFSDYLCEIRINAAKDMLRNTNKSIGEIANECGFNDSRYFSKVFHKSMNMTPSKYRNLKD